jgi:hypothetical protein
MYDQYAMWNDPEWCVIARERVGGPDVSVISVQFVPIKPSMGVAEATAAETRDREHRT